MKVYAGIGSRKLNQNELSLCYHIGKYMARLGWTIRTGAAVGADQAFADGALSIGGKAILCLPWPTYEEQWVSWALSQGAQIRVLKDSDLRAWAWAEKFTKPGVRRLMARNWLIVAGVKFTVAWPKKNEMGYLGGTGHGMNIAKEKGQEVKDLSNPETRTTIAAKVIQSLMG